MFPKHNLKNQILKNVSKTQSQRPNFQTFFQNTNTKIKLSNLRRGMSQTQPGQQFLEEKFYIVSLSTILCTIFVQLSPCAQPLHNKLLGKTTSSLYFTSSSPLYTSAPVRTSNGGFLDERRPFHRDKIVEQLKFSHYLLDQTK